MALKAYHWSFLAQPFLLPETLIAGNLVFYLEWTLRSWAKGQSLDVFDARSLRERILIALRVRLTNHAHIRNAP